MLRLRILYTIILVLLLQFQSKADRVLPPLLPLSENATISLLTCDPGNQLYTTFGHSAIRVKDPNQNLDIVFNYGTFNFNVPNFYLKFASGKLLYKLSFESYKRFMYMYLREDRSVYEQVLNLSVMQNQALFDKIRENYLPENRYYKYDFFFDNCATRIIDIFDSTLGDSLVCNPDVPIKENTFRQLLNEYLKNSDWSSLGINLILGSVIDEKATELEKTFLPDYLKAYCDNLFLGEKPLVKTDRFLLEGTFEVPPTKFFVSPKFWFWLLFVIVFALTFLYKKQSWIIPDKSIFFFTGFIGLLLLLAGTATDHEATRLNLNLLWIHPLYIVFAGFIGSKQRKTTLVLSSFFIVLNAIVLIGWFWLPQKFSPMFIPIILLICLRLIVICIRNR